MFFRDKRTCRLNGRQVLLFFLFFLFFLGKDKFLA